MGERPYPYSWPGRLVTNLASDTIFLPNIAALATNYKVLTRWYLVPARIHKFLPQYPPHCFRGCSEAGTHFNIWWYCSIVQSFSLDVFAILSKHFATSRLPEPAVAFLNSKPMSLTYCQFKRLLFVSTAAKQTISKAWKSASLCILETKHRTTPKIINANLEAVLTDKVDKFDKLWNPWVIHYLPPGFNETLLLQ